MDQQLETPRDESLTQTLERYAVELPAEQVELVERYCRLLWDWNSKLNLTRHTDFETFVTRDLWDTRELSEAIEPGGRVLDWGAGGGVPGLLLALLRPDLHVELCESVGKKAAALKDMVHKLGVPVPVHAQRLEQILQRTRKPYQAITARAVGPLYKMLLAVQPYWDKFEALYTIKGPKWVDERGEARHRGLLHALQLRRARHYTNPGAGWESSVLKIWKRQGDE